ncbi:MAG: 50S ribosomal protein L6 [Desulfurococcaceae archaeon]
MVKHVYLSEKIKIPEGVEVKVEDLKITVKGPRGELTKDFTHVGKNISIRLEDNNIVVEAYMVNRKTKALMGSVVAHVRNMIIGVTKGFKYKLKIIYSHFPITVVVDEKNKLVRIKNFLGEKADRIAKIYGNVRVIVQGTDIIVEGNDIEEVGLTAASLERATKIKDLDRRIFVDGIYIYERGVVE